jgi:hypothetical protein
MGCRKRLLFRRLLRSRNVMGVLPGGPLPHKGKCLLTVLNAFERTGTMLNGGGIAPIQRGARWCWSCGGSEARIWG